MRKIKVTNNTTVIPLGRQGENYALQVQFPILDWKEIYGEDGEFKILHKRSSDSYAYEVTTETDENYVYWNVDRIDTQSKGIGRAEILYLIDGAVAKSVVYTTKVEEAIGDAGTAKYIDVSKEGM